MQCRLNSVNVLSFYSSLHYIYKWPFSAHCRVTNRKGINIIVIAGIDIKISSLKMSSRNTTLTKKMYSKTHLKFYT